MQFKLTGTQALLVYCCLVWSLCVTELGLAKSLFVNDNTTSVHRSAQIID